MCLRCAFITRHEYGADSSSEAAANDGTAHGTAPASPPGTEDTSAGWTGTPAAETSTDMFTCFGSSSACSRFAILFEKTGRVTTEHFRFEEGSTQPVVMSSCRRLPVRRRTTGRIRSITHLTIQGVIFTFTNKLKYFISTIRFYYSVLKVSKPFYSNKNIYFKYTLIFKST